MGDNNYTVILCYDPDRTDIHRKIIACLKRFNSKAASRLAKADITGRLVVKRDTDLKTAKGLRRAFGETGARIDIRKTPIPSAPSDCRPSSEPGEPMNASSRRSPSALMTCPNCSCQQPADIECSSCGIIFAKVKIRNGGEPPAPESSDAVDGSEPSPRTPSIAKAPKAFVLGQVNVVLEKIHQSLGMDKWSAWSRSVADGIMQCGLMFVIALALEVGFSFMFRMLWLLYQETTTGKVFMTSNPEQFEMIQRVTNIDPLSLGWDITLTVLWAGFVIGCAAQFLHLFRYLYASQQLVGKLALWFAPFIWLTSWLIGQQNPYPEIFLGCTMVAIPSLCLLPACLYLARALVPEAGQVKNFVLLLLENKGSAWSDIHYRIRDWFASSGQQE